MAEAAIAVLSDQARWQRMSTEAAADARSRFSLDDIVGSYVDFYELTLRLVAERTRRAPV
jgi:glycosyltransferase involved in cell wall biosynthesis